MIIPILILIAIICILIIFAGFFPTLLICVISAVVFAGVFYLFKRFFGR